MSTIRLNKEIQEFLNKFKGDSYKTKLENLIFEYTQKCNTNVTSEYNSNITLSKNQKLEIQKMINESVEMAISDLKVYGW